MTRETAIEHAVALLDDGPLLARLAARAYVDSREALGFPLLKENEAE